MGKGFDNEQARDANDNEVKAKDADKGPEPKSTSSERADQMLTKRLASPKTSLDFGERIVGSEATEQVLAPWNIGSVPATTTFAVSGGEFSLNSSQTMTLNPSGTMKGPDVDYQLKASPKVQFAPRKGGDARGVLTMTVVWNDGHTETQTVALYGRSKTLDQAASQDPSGEELADDQRAQQRLADQQSEQDAAVKADSKKEAVYSPDFDSAVDDAAFAASQLAQRQRDGVDLIDHETKAYQKMVEKAPYSIWGDLLEIALSMATAGIAAHFAKVLMPKLLGATVSKVDDFPIPGHPGETVTEFIPHKFSEFTTDFMKEGVKQVGKKAIGALKGGGGGGGDKKKDHAPGGEQSSSNPEISFFSQQWKILSAQAKGNHALVKTHAKYARPMLRTQPQQAIATMKKLEESFTETGDHAETEQANQLAPQWATLISRLALGTEKTNTADGNHEQDALKTESLRDNRGSQAPKTVDGVLDIYLNGDYTAPRLEGAKLFGMSQEIADRLGALPLANLPMPIRFVLGPRDDKPIIITRDEAGRVRVSGTLRGESREENAVAEAQKIIDRFLSTPLSAANVEIQTNDATGRR